MRQFAHGEFAHPNAFAAEFARHGIAQSAFCVMIFHRQNQIICLLRRRQNHVSSQRLDAVCIDDRYPRARGFQGIRRFERFVKCHSGGNHRNLIIRRLA
jgi:hypothetical protein